MRDGGRRAIVIITALLAARTALADPAGMVEVNGPTPAAPQAVQVDQKAKPHERPALSFDVGTRLVCLEVLDIYGCNGGAQFGLGMRYGEVHAGVLGGTDGGVSYPVVAPFIGGEVGTRHYTLVEHQRWTFGLAGRAALDLIFLLRLKPDEQTFVAFMNTVGPSLVWTFGKRAELFFRGGAGWSIVGSSANFAVDSRLGVAVRF
ncbi:MAG: hypothetical protein JWM53_2509 [bacterium]|nr:hypothetical protein [bacterium]